MAKILDDSIQNTITILRQWYLMLTGQECSGNSSLHLEDFKDHLFGSFILFSLIIFQCLRFERAQFVQSPCTKTNRKHFSKRYKKKEAHNFLKTFSAGLSSKLFIH